MAKCAVCGGGVGITSLKLADKQRCCYKCYTKCGFKTPIEASSRSAGELQELVKNMDKSAADVKTFKATKSVKKYIDIDEVNKKWLVKVGKNPVIYDFADLSDFELLEDGKTKSGLGSALGGGFLFGPLGAIVGGITGKGKRVCNSLKIKITLKGVNAPILYLDFLNTRTKVNSITYKTSMEFVRSTSTLLQLIKDSNKDTPQVAAASVADEIAKFKDLAEKGIITQEEFDAKKKQLLGI